MSILIVGGQLLRLPLNISSIGVLYADILIPLFVGIWFTRHILFQKALPKTRIGGSIYVLLGVLTLSLVTVAFTIPFKELAIAGSYLIRHSFYLLLFFPLVSIVKEHKELVLRLSLISAILLSILGILQYIYIPDFTFMAIESGWDPHIGRLLSTWYDPNFIAGYFAFIITMFTSIWYLEEKKGWRTFIPAALLFVTVCFVLTYSRSGIVALAAGIGLLGIMKFRTLLIISLCLFIVGLQTSERFAERFYDMVNGALAITTNSLDYDIDLTSQERLSSWAQTGSLMQGRTLTGIGFNTIKYWKVEKGLEANANRHSNSGSDSSILNHYITAGVLGVLAFLYWLYMLTSTALLSYIRSDKKSIQSIGLGMFAAIIALFFHSFFVNSLLYPLFLMTLLPFIAMLENTWQLTPSSKVGEQKVQA